MDRFKSSAGRPEHAVLSRLLHEAFPAYPSFDEVPWAQLSAGKEILGATDPKAILLATTERILAIRGKPGFSNTLVWADYDTVPDFHYKGLFEEVFKRLIRKKHAFHAGELERLLAFAARSHIPSASIIGHVERYADTQPLIAKLKNALKRYEKVTWDTKLEARIELLLKGAQPKPKKAPDRFIGADPWVLMANQAVADSDVTKSWRALIQHCSMLKSTTPSKSWQRRADALVEEMDHDVYEKALRGWLLAFKKLDTKDTKGRKSHRDLEERNAALLRGLIRALPRPAEFARALHRTASAAYTKVPDCGPRSPVVGNACAAALAQGGTDECIRALFELRYNTDYSATQRLIDKAIAGIAEERSQLPAQLEKSFGALSEKRGRNTGTKPAGKKSSQSLLNDIYQNPTDTGLREVYADQLSDAGDVRGEFIVLQLQGVTKAQKQREKELVKKHWQKWLGKLAPVVMKGGLRFEGGFPVEARLDDKKRSALHRLTHEPDWSTFQALNLNTSAWPEPNKVVDSFLAQAPLLNLRTATSLHVQNLVELCDTASELQLETLGLHSQGLEELSKKNQEQLASASASVLQKVKNLQLDSFYSDITTLDWLWKSPFVQQLKSLRYESSNEVLEFLPILKSLQNLDIASTGWFQYERQSLGYHIDIHYPYTYEAARIVLARVLKAMRLFGKEVTRVRIKLHSDIKRSEKDLGPLSRYCESLDLEKCLLPKPKG